MSKQVQWLLVPLKTTQEKLDKALKAAGICCAVVNKQDVERAAWNAGRESVLQQIVLAEKVTADHLDKLFKKFVKRQTERVIHADPPKKTKRSK